MKSTNVKGLYIINDFLDQEEETEIIKEMNKCKWIDNRQGDRKVQVYGPYHDRHYKIIPNKYSKHPEWVKKLAKKVHDSINDSNKHKLLDEKNCEVFVNQYKNFQGLQYHFDHLGTYDENIYGVSLNTNGFMGFKKNKELYKVPISARSMYIMGGDSRKEYKHGILYQCHVYIPEKNINMALIKDG